VLLVRDGAIINLKTERAKAPGWNDCIRNRMRNGGYAAFLALFLPVATLIAEAESNFLNRVQSHLILKDPTSALEELQKALSLYPDSEKLLSAKIQTLACCEQEKEMILAWKQFYKLHPVIDANLLETIAWGIIKKGSKSDSPITRATAMIGAFFSQSATGVSILHQGMSDRSSLVRSVAVNLAGNMRDAILQQDILDLIRHERITAVRLGAIQSAGMMKLARAYDNLKENLEKKHLSQEEVGITIAALVNIYEKADQAHILSLLHSSRAALRLLGCELILKFSLERDKEELKALTYDSHPEVRKIAFQVLGGLDLPSEEGILLGKQGIKDPCPQVAISAAWLLMLYDRDQGVEALEPWLFHATREVRLFAASALAASGQYGVPLSLKLVREHTDPFVCVNLAIHLIRQRTQEQFGCRCIQRFLSEDLGKIMWKKNGIFQSLEPSDLKHGGKNEANPEVQDQLTRLELLQMLAIMQTPDVQESVKKFLRERAFGITGAAAALLLFEGDEEAIETVKGLLEDSDPRIRIQAAFVLAQWGRDESAIGEFANVYATTDRENKEKILEGLGKIGAPSTLPFLIDQLSEPHQNLRVIAASSILQSLYH